MPFSLSVGDYILNTTDTPIGVSIGEPYRLSRSTWGRPGHLFLVGALFTGTPLQIEDLIREKYSTGTYQLFDHRNQFNMRSFIVLETRLPLGGRGYKPMLLNNRHMTRSYKKLSPLEVLARIDDIDFLERD